MDLIKKQFAGPYTWYLLGGIAAVHVLAVFVRDTQFALPALIVIGLATLVLTLKSLPYGLFVAFAEVFVGGHGHLIAAEVAGFSVSLRMVLFAAVMLGWAILLIKKDVSLKLNPWLVLPWALLVLAVGLGALMGFLSNEAGNAFDDANGYIAVGYLLPMLSIEWKSIVKKQLLQTVFASVIWLAVFTLGLSFAFNHLDGDTLSHVYTFVRDARLAEVTLQTYPDSQNVAAYWYRIFMQSHFYVVWFALLLLSALMMFWREQRVPFKVDVVLVLLGSTLVTSMSRSFTLGLIVAAGMVVVLAFFQGKKPLKNIAVRTVLSAVLIAGSVALAAGVALVPPKQDITQAAFYETSGDIDRDLAISSRWQLLPEMMEEIYASPIVGQGFGKEVTFISDDPRVRAINPNGEWTAYRFEWGWQDVWLKMGIPGLLAFFIYAVVIIEVGRYTLRKHKRAWLTAGLLSTLVMLYVAHIFTPFLNHPIGLVAMLLPIPFMDWEGWTAMLAEHRKKKLVKAKQMQMSPAMSVEND